MIREKCLIGGVLVALVCSAAISANATVVTLDYYRMGENDAGAAAGSAGNAVTKDLVGTNDLTQIGTPSYSSDVSSALAGKSSLSMQFNGGSTADGYQTGVFCTATDNFGVELYAKSLGPNNDVSNFLVYNGNGGESGWGLMVYSGNYQVLFGGIAFGPSTPLVQNTWVQLAMVRNNGVTTLYKDGVAVGTPITTTPSSPDSYYEGDPCAFSIGEVEEGTKSLFNGRIDEVRVFTFQPGQFSTSDLTYVVPEPSTLALLTTALLGLLAYAWHRRK